MPVRTYIHQNRGDPYLQGNLILHHPGKSSPFVSLVLYTFVSISKKKADAHTEQIDDLFPLSVSVAPLPQQLALTLLCAHVHTHKHRGGVLLSSLCFVYKKVIIPPTLLNEVLYLIYYSHFTEISLTLFNSYILFRNTDVPSFGLLRSCLRTSRCVPLRVKEKHFSFYHP